MKGEAYECRNDWASAEDSGMEMGVFVAHTIYWGEPSLSTGDPEKLEQFLR